MWLIAEPHVQKRVSVYGNGVPVVEYVATDRYGRHVTRLGAMRRYLELMDRDLAGASDKMIRLHWRVAVRNGRVKCVREA